MCCRILIADGHQIVRSALRSLFERQFGWKVCAEVQRGDQVLGAALASRPNIVVMEASPPDRSGIAAARSVKSALPQTEVMIFTTRASDEAVLEAVSAGVRGYILKSDSIDDLMDAMKNLEQHRPGYSPSVTELLLQIHSGVPLRNRIDQLTRRERQVAQLITDGVPNWGIAEAMDISVKTVESHRATLMRKAGVTTRIDLVKFAIRNHLVEA